MYLLDTCVCVDLMRGRLPIAYDIMRASDPNMFAVPAVVVAELDFGIQKSAQPEKNRLFTERFLAPFFVVPFDDACARAYGSIREDLRSAECKSGRTI